MQTVIEHNLIARLRAIHKALGISERAFSQKCGWSPSFWNKVQAGDSKIGQLTGERMLRVYPELREALVEYWLQTADEPGTQATR